MNFPEARSSLRKLNIGCGYDKRDGYVNIDVDPADVMVWTTSA